MLSVRLALLFLLLPSLAAGQESDDGLAALELNCRQADAYLKVCWEKGVRQTDPKRYSALAKMTYGLFPLTARPRQTLYIFHFETFERRFLFRWPEVLPSWEGGRILVRAHTYIDETGRVVETYEGGINDLTFVHELLHDILYQSGPEHTLNSNPIVDHVVNSPEMLKAYRALVKSGYRMKF